MPILSHKIAKNHLTWSIEGKGSLTLQEINLQEYGSPSPGLGYLVKNVFVYPEARRQGIATALYQELKKYIQNNQLRLFRGSHLEEVEAIYKKIGAEAVPSNLHSNSIKEEIIFNT